MELMIDSLDPQQQVQSRLEYREEVLGKRSAKLTFTMNLAPTGTAAASGVSAVTGALGTILKAVMGGESKGAGTTFTSGSTASVVNLTSAAESNLRPVASDDAVAASARLASRSVKLDAPGDWGYLAAAVALLCIVLQVVWLTRRPDRVDSGNIRPLRPERRGAA